MPTPRDGQARRRVRMTECVMPECTRLAHRNAKYPLCLAHLLGVWQHVEASDDRPTGEWEGEPKPMPTITSEEAEARALAARERQRRAAAQVGTLYVLDAHDGMVKIGWTSRELTQRLDQYPPHFRLIVAVPGSRADERDVHRSLRHALSKGREWYDPTSEVVRLINEWITKANALAIVHSKALREQYPQHGPFDPRVLPPFTSLAEWGHDLRRGPHNRREAPAPSARRSARLTG